MYANESQVRALIVNKKSTTSSADITSVGATIDPQIDAKLSSSFYWPNDSSGAAITPPALVIVAASYLTAAVIESQSFAMNEAGQATPNPYARSLKTQGWQMIEDILIGETFLSVLVRIDAPTVENPDSVFEPVHGSMAGRGRP